MNYLKKSFCKKYKYYVMMELTFLKKSTLIKQANQKSAIFATIGIFQITSLIFNLMFAMDAMIY